MNLNFLLPDEVKDILSRSLIGSERPLYYDLLRRLDLTWAEYKDLPYYEQLEAKQKVQDYIDLLLSDEGAAELEGFTLFHNCRKFSVYVKYAKPYNDIMVALAVTCTKQEADMLIDRYKKGLSTPQIAEKYGFTDRRRAGEAIKSATIKIVRRLTAAAKKHNE